MILNDIIVQEVVLCDSSAATLVTFYWLEAGKLAVNKNLSAGLLQRHQREDEMLPPLPAN